MVTVDQFVAAARSEKGYTECPRDARGRCRFTGHTGAGANHTKFAAEAGLTNGVYWCAVFVSAIARRMGVAVAGAPTASTRALKASAEHAGAWVGPQDVRVGDVLLYHLTGRNGAGQPDHTGICVGVIRDKAGRVTAVVAIEGNTSSGSAGSQDNGGGVFERTRPISEVLGASRPSFTVSAETPAAPAAFIEEEDELKIWRPVGNQGVDPNVGGEFLQMGDKLISLDAAMKQQLANGATGGDVSKLPVQDAEPHVWAQLTKPGACVVVE